VETQFLVILNPNGANPMTILIAVASAAISSYVTYQVLRVIFKNVLRVTLQDSLAREAGRLHAYEVVVGRIEGRLATRDKTGELTVEQILQWAKEQCTQISATLTHRREEGWQAAGESMSWRKLFSREKSNGKNDENKD
jgi:hypothetical protein